MEPKNMNIVFSSALLDIVEQNPSFDAGKLRIAYTGRNRNNTFISKESFERAIPTMFNCPVVANYIRKDNEIGSHDGEFIKDKDGETQYVNITEPVGLVPESAEWYWDTVEDNGVIHQYLCTDVVLWKRQEAYKKIKDNGVTKQSMEIEVTNGEMLDDYYDIKDFCFTAFCLLGTAEPCFESAALFTFEQQESFKSQYTEMLKEFKLAFASADNTNDKKEGEENLKLKELLEKYSVSESDLDFEVDGLTDEELEAKFVECFNDTDSVDDEGDEPDDDGSEENPDIDDDEEDTEKFTLESQIREQLRTAICEEKISTEWGEYCRYWMVDYDSSVNEVYYCDSEDGALYGCPYRFDGDDIIVDFENCKKKKFAIVDYVEGAETQEFELFNLIEVFNEKYHECIEKIEQFDVDEFNRLKEFETNTLADQRQIKEAELFERFGETLKDNEEFEALKDKASEYELDALEKELFVLVGKVNFTFSQKEKAAPAPSIVFEKEPAGDGMDELFAFKKDE